MGSGGNFEQRVERLSLRLTHVSVSTEREFDIVAGREKEGDGWEGDGTHTKMVCGGACNNGAYTHLESSPAMSWTVGDALRGQRRAIGR